MKRETVAVIIPTFGEPSAYWNALAARALQSVALQTRPPDQVFRVHDKTLAEARNDSGFRCNSDWLCFLDADDELEPTYIETMLEGSADIRYPAVRVCCGTPDEKIKLPAPIHIEPRTSFLDGNHIVIGAFIRSGLFFEIGGFEDYEACEDWALWLAAWVHGASFEAMTKAIYRQHWRAGSRNQLERKRYASICIDIREKFRPLAKAKGLI